ncbi:MAG: hypothetical protein JNK78_08195, partial [Planctomycetes bacterium]|nr:hypothetical protein [Planctomycetota bacterium]
MERPDRTKEIFIAALPVPPGERRAWLERQCAGDAALQAQVQSLLEAHDKAGSFLVDAGGDVRGAAAATVDGSRERAGETIGA